jgi:hypothetical protein
MVMLGVSNLVPICDYPIQVQAGLAYTFIVYSKIDSINWTQLPVLSLFAAGGDPLAGNTPIWTATMANNTSWQTWTVTYTPTYNQTVILRTMAQNATGNCYTGNTMSIAGVTMPQPIRGSTTTIPCQFVDSSGNPLTGVSSVIDLYDTNGTHAISAQALTYMAGGYYAAVLAATAIGVGMAYTGAITTSDSRVAVQTIPVMLVLGQNGNVDLLRVGDNGMTSVRAGKIDHLQADITVTPVGGTAQSGDTFAWLNTAFTSATTALANIAAAVWSVSTRSLTTFGTLASDSATAVWAAGTRTLTGFGTLTTDTATAVWSVLTTTMTTAGSIGKKFADWVVGQVTGYATNQDPGTALTTYGGAKPGDAMTLTTAYDAAKSAASQSSVNNIAGNFSLGSISAGDQFQRSMSESKIYELDIVIRDLDGNNAAPDAAPVIHARDVAGDSLDANLGSTTMTIISLGLYKVQYTVHSTDVLQQVLFDVTWALNGLAKHATCSIQIVDTYAVDFTDNDRVNLQLITDSLPTGGIPDAASWTPARALKLDNLNDTVTSRMASFTYVAPDNADIVLIKAKTDNLPPIPASQGDVTDATSTITGAISSAVTTITNAITAVWTVTTRTLSGFGTLVADIWAYTSRTITSGGITKADVGDELATYGAAKTSDVTTAVSTLAADIDSLPTKTDLSNAATDIETAVNAHTDSAIGDIDFATLPSKTDLANGLAPLATTSQLNEVELTLAADIAGIPSPDMSLIAKQADLLITKAGVASLNSKIAVGMPVINVISSVDVDGVLHIIAGNNTDPEGIVGRVVEITVPTTRNPLNINSATYMLHLPGISPIVIGLPDVDETNETATWKPELSVTQTSQLILGENLYSIVGVYATGEKTDWVHNAILSVD